MVAEHHAIRKSDTKPINESTTKCFRVGAELSAITTTIKRSDNGEGERILEH
jgi:hypothetical protein